MELEETIRLERLPDDLYYETQELKDAVAKLNEKISSKRAELWKLEKEISGKKGWFESPTESLGANGSTKGSGSGVGKKANAVRSRRKHNFLLLLRHMTAIRLFADSQRKTVSRSPRRSQKDPKHPL